MEGSEGGSGHPARAWGGGSVEWGAGNPQSHSNGQARMGLWGPEARATALPPNEGEYLVVLKERSLHCGEPPPPAHTLGSSGAGTAVFCLLKQ